MIKQKVAVVTGAARGIGRGIALQLAKDGCAIVIFDILEPKKVEKNIKEHKEEGQPIFYFQGDLAQSKDRNNFCKRVMKEYGRIDILVNNAGVAPRIRMDILETTEESFDFVRNNRNNRVRSCNTTKIMLYSYYVQTITFRI